MTLYRMVDGVEVELSPEEEQEQRNEWASNNAAKEALANSYITKRTNAITALGPFAIYEATHGAGSYNQAVADIIAQYPPN